MAFSFGRIFGGALTAATITLSMFGASSAFAADAPSTKACRDSVTQEWLYDSEGYDCHNVDRPGNPRPVNNSAYTDKDYKEIIVDGVKWSIDKNGYTGPGYNPVTKMWLEGTGPAKTPPTEKTPAAPQPKCTEPTPYTADEYKKVIVRGKEYEVDRHGVTRDSYIPETDTRYIPTPEDGKKCEPEGMAKPATEMKKEEKSREGRPGKMKKRIMWKDGRPVAPAPAKY
jgi:hypothetical protein